MTIVVCFHGQKSTNLPENPSETNARHGNQTPQPAIVPAKHESAPRAPETPPPVPLRSPRSVCFGSDRQLRKEAERWRREGRAPRFFPECSGQ